MFLVKVKGVKGPKAKKFNAILTKHKIISSKAHELSSGESRIAISADIKIDDAMQGKARYTYNTSGGVVNTFFSLKPY